MTITSNDQFEVLQETDYTVLQRNAPYLGELLCRIAREKPNCTIITTIDGPDQAFASLLDLAVKTTFQNWREFAEGNLSVQKKLDQHIGISSFNPQAAHIPAIRHDSVIVAISGRGPRELEYFPWKAVESLGVMNKNILALVVGDASNKPLMNELEKLAQKTNIPLLSRG